MRDEQKCHNAASVATFHSTPAIQITDQDLPPIARTEANYWKAQYFQALRELAKANKGIRRLNNRLNNTKPKTSEEG